MQLNEKKTALKAVEWVIQCMVFNYLITLRGNAVASEKERKREKKSAEMW